MDNCHLRLSKLKNCKNSQLKYILIYIYIYIIISNALGNNISLHPTPAKERWKILPLADTLFDGCVSEGVAFKLLDI